MKNLFYYFYFIIVKIILIYFSDGHKDIAFNSAQYKYKIAEEKQQREHLLQLNQILAQQVTEKSKIVAGIHYFLPDL